MIDNAEEYNDLFRFWFRLKLSHAVEGCVFSAIMLPRQAFNSKLARLKALKLYPYRITRRNLKLHDKPTFKLKLIALSKLLLCFEPYARFYALILRGVKR